jgi:peptidoglycan/LPS O-acetylase OafA/YrhL
VKNTPPADLLQAPLSPRLEWLSGLRGICSLWIVYFHLYASYVPKPFPKINSSYFQLLYERYSDLSIYGRLGGFTHDLLAVMSLHAVGIFILMSGFGLTRSLLKQQENKVNWAQWYQQRFWRLYPFLWFAHLVFLLAPFIYRPEPIDWRFLVSLTGIRAYPMEMMMFYANPAWWFFWLILQLYLFFPLLFRLFRKVPIWWFLAITLGITFLSRWLILFVWQDWRGMIIGGLFTSRLAEFALGMAIAYLWQKNPDNFTSRMTNWKTFWAGLLIYPLALTCYTSLTSYIFVDFLTTLGLFLITAQVAHWLSKINRIHTALAFAGTVSLSTFLLHQPWAITLGESVKGQPWWIFALITVIFIPVMVWTAYGSEQLVKIIVQQIRQTKRV